MQLLVFLAVLFVGHGVKASEAASWHQYVRAPSSNIFKPQSIFNVSGGIENADGLLTGDDVVTLDRPTNGSAVPSITLDFGLNIVGFTRIHFAGASTNNPGIRLTFSETKEYLRNVSDFTRSDNGDTITPGTDQYAVPSSPTLWTNSHGCQFNGSKVCSDGLHGFRYMRIALDALASDSPFAQPYGTVNISAIELEYYGYLGHPDTFTGYFECSDPELSQWWYDAAYTNDMCTAVFTRNTTDPRDAFSPSLDGKPVLQDGAKRDRDPYVGDVAVSGRTTYLTHMQNSVAARNVLADLAEHQRRDGWIPPASIDNYTLPLFDYPMWWVVSSWEYVLYTGDTAFAEQYWPNLVRVLDTFYPSVLNTSSGLLSKGLGVTEGYGDYAFLPRTGQVTYYNALYVYALHSGAAWSSHLNDSTTATQWLSRAAGVSAAVNTHLWDPAAGAYTDSTNLTTTNSTPVHAQDGNALAVLTALAPSDRASRALAYLASPAMARPYGNAFYDAPVPGVEAADQRVYAFLSFFELQARLSSLSPSAHVSAVEELKRLYGWMSPRDPGVTFWEGVGAGGGLYEEGYTSMAHGWSTGIVGVLTNYVLGIRPTAPGWRGWEVRPRTAGLGWAKGGTGGLEVCWSVHGGDRWEEGGGKGYFEMVVTAEKGTEGVVFVPVVVSGKEDEGQRKMVEWNGEVLDAEVVDGYIKVDGVGPGKHSFVVR